MATKDYTKPDFQTMYDRINQAWNTAVTRADENRRRYITDLGYTSNDPTYTSQAARLAQGQAPATTVGNYQWTKNPYSAVQGLMRSGGNEKAALRDSFRSRGISGGLVNQAESQVDFATGGERMQFGQNMMDQLLNMDRNVLDASQQYRDNTQDVKKAEADYNLEQQYLQNPENDPAKPPAKPNPVKPNPSIDGRKDTAATFIKQLQARKNPKKNLNALYAYMRVNKNKLSKNDVLMLQKMARAYRTQIVGTTGTMGNKNYGGFTSEGRF